MNFRVGVLLTTAINKGELQYSVTKVLQLPWALVFPDEEANGNVQ